MTEAPPERPGRNEPCHCGSGKKYKHCCLAKDEETERAAREHEASAAPQAAPAGDEPSPRATPPPRPTSQPWKRAAQSTRGARRVTTPRKAG
jgi:hypothetical protein